MSQETPTRVLVVDDHAVVRGGLRLFLLAFDDLELVGEANSGERALVSCADLQPDVVLMDLVMPGMGGVEAIRLIRQRHPAIQVIALTSFPEDELVQAALRAGAIGYLLKTISAGDLAAAIRAAAAGQPTLAPEATQALLRQAGPPAVVVSESTAKFHVSNILAKLQAGSRAEAVAIALQSGLVERQS